MPTSEFPLRFVSESSDFGCWPEVEAYYQRLDQRSLDGAAAVEQWLVDASELESVVSEEEQNRYVAMTCQTDDPQRERRYLEFIENVSPHLKRWRDRLDRKLMAGREVERLPSRYKVLMRQVRNRVEIFRDENVPLQTEDEKLRTRYQKLCGAMTVQFDGREQTLQQMARYLEENDRSRRQAAWEGVAARRYQDRDAIDALYDEMVALRHRIAGNAGFANYRDYMFRALERFDYTPADCERFHATVEAVVVPVVRRLQDERRRAMGLDRLRPWDTAVDPLGRPPLRPFSSAAELVEKCDAIFDQVLPEFGRQFARMRADGLLDLDSRKGKAPGGYMTVFERRRLPFIFTNAVGLHKDVQTLLHEGGHAFHSFATRDEPLLSYRNPPIEFAEVASMGMELLAARFLDAFYAPADAARAVRSELEDILAVLTWIATIDAFQHWVYSHPTHTRTERSAAWLAIRQRFGGIEDWTGYEHYRQTAWHRQLHPFTVPFYYIEYGIAQLGALQVWLNSKRDYAPAVASYHAALRLGGSRPLPELFSTAGARLDFGESAIRPAVAALEAEIRSLS